MSRVPTRKQYERLGLIARPGIGISAPHRSGWGSLRGRGWTRDIDGTVPVGGSYLPPQQITPAGLRALADAMERYEGEGGRG